MIRLVVALVVSLALHPRAPAASARQRSLAAATVAPHGVPAVVDAALALPSLALPSLALRLEAPPIALGTLATLRSRVATCRIWLFCQRLLC